MNNLVGAPTNRVSWRYIDFTQGGVATAEVHTSRTVWSLSPQVEPVDCRPGVVWSPGLLAVELDRM